MLKRFAFALITVVFALSSIGVGQSAPDPAIAQVVPEDQRASRDEVEQFFTAMRLRKNMEMVFQAMREQMKGMSHKMMSDKLSTLTPEQQKKFQEAMQGSMDDVMDAMRFEDLISDMIPVYQRYLTREDLQGVIAFYSSPVGQRLLDKTPAMTTEAMKISMERMEKMMPEIMAKMQKRMDEIIKEMGDEKSSAPKKIPAASKS
jgi:uncharacterized protein